MYAIVTISEQSADKAESVHVIRSALVPLCSEP